MDDSEQIHQLKIKQMVDMIMSSLLILPFMKLNPEGIDKINKKLQKKEYKDKNQVFQDLTSVLSHESDQEYFTVEILLENEDSKRRIVIKRDDLKNIIEQMKKKITCITTTLSFEDQLRENPLAGKILTALRSRFPNVTEDKLKAEACKISTFNEEDWKQIVARMNQENENNKPGAVYKRFRFCPSQGLAVGGEEAVHQHIAGLQFYRMLAKWTQPGAVIPVPLRKVELTKTFSGPSLTMIVSSSRLPTHKMQSPVSTMSRTLCWKRLLPPRRKSLEKRERKRQRCFSSMAPPWLTWIPF